MMIEEGLRTFLLAQTTVAALVADRIYGLLRPVAAVLPNIMLQRSGTTRQVLFCGTNPLVDANIQLDCFAMDSEQVWGVAQACRRALIDFTGLMGATYVDHCTLANELPLVDPDPGVIRVTQLYNVWYVED